MSAAAPQALPAAPAPPRADPREARARPSLQGFALVLGQLLVVTAVAWRVDRQLFAFAAVVVACFCVHYWTPFRFKEQVWIALCLVGGGVAMGLGGGMVASRGGGVVAGLEVAAFTLVCGVVIHGIVASKLAFWTRAGLVAAIFAAVLVCGTWFHASLPLPPGSFRAFGVIFMLNVFPYLRDAQHARRPATFREFARTFFALPSYRLNAPFLDVGKMAQSFYARDAQRIAQQGVYFIVSGAVQYALCELAKPRVYYAMSAADVRSPRNVLLHLVYVYGFYLHTSGSLTMYVGALNLFGYDMPECYRWFGFAHSPLDFWRRANIYYKDAMSKVVYIPIYFALRKSGEVRAKVVGIFVVFVCTWAVHVWVMSFFSDLNRSMWAIVRSMPMEAGFWGMMGCASVLDMYLEARAEERGAGRAPRKLPPPRPGPGLAGKIEQARRYLVERIGLPAGMGPVRGAIQIVAMQLFMACLFSLQHAPTLRAWLNTLRFWS